MRDGGGDVEGDLLVAAEDEGAGILEAPGDEGHDEVGGERDGGGLEGEVDGEIEGMVLAVEVEDAMRR